MIPYKTIKYGKPTYSLRRPGEDEICKKAASKSGSLCHRSSCTQLKMAPTVTLGLPGVMMTVQ
jgi:hypothetical protein